MEHLHHNHFDMMLMVAMGNQTTNSTGHEHYSIGQSFNAWLVVVSFLLATLGSFTTLQLMFQTRYSKSKLGILFWITCASIALGCCAIWSMHFIGVLAVGLRVKELGDSLLINYDRALTAVSTIISTVSCWIGLAITTLHMFSDRFGNVLENQHHAKRAVDQDPETSSCSTSSSSEIRRRASEFRNLVKDQVKRRSLGDKLRPNIIQILLGAVFTATGVCAMHYMGMQGMKMENVRMSYNIGFVALSVIIAYVASTAALWIAFNMHYEWQQIIAALIMAVAVCGMHYTGAGAVVYSYDPTVTLGKLNEIHPVELSLGVIIVSCATCFVMILFISISSSGTRKETERMLVMVQEEKEISENLLLNILPSKIAARMKMGEIYIADEYKEVSVLFSDIVGFTSLSSYIPPRYIVLLLHELVTNFDRVLEKRGLEKIKTIGDAYMCVCGLPEPNEDHAMNTVLFGLEMIDLVQKFNRERLKTKMVDEDEKTTQSFQKRKSWYSHSSKNKSVATVDDFDIHPLYRELRHYLEDISVDNMLQIRVGISSGPVVGAVIGENKFLFDIFGDTVNTASRMESYGFPMKVQVSQATYELTRDLFIYEKRPGVEIKGKGLQDTYLVGSVVTPEFGPSVDESSTQKDFTVFRYKEVETLEHE